MQGNKLIVFDWGGVVECHSGADRTAAQSWITVMHRLGASDSDEVILKRVTDACALFSINTVDCPKMAGSFVKYLCAESGVAYPGFSSFSELYKEEFIKTGYYNNIVNYIHSLRGRCRLGVLSNLTMLDRDRIDYQMDLSVFEHVWLSFELGLEKPDPEIFLQVETCASPQDILFIDDTYENTAAAAAHGWNVHLVQEGDLIGICAAVERFLASY